MMRILAIHAIALAAVFGGAIAARAENPDHVRQLLETNECEGCDLSNSRLQGMDLTGAMLEDSNLSGANLTNTNLSRVSLQGANLSQATLTGATLQGTNLTGASLRDVIINDSCGEFFGAMMFGARSDRSTCMAMQLLQALGPEEFCQSEQWNEAVIQASGLCKPEEFSFLTGSLVSQFFITPNFQGANFSNADLTGVDLSTADLRYATLSGANLTETTFDLAILMETNIENTEGGDFSQAIFSGDDVANLLVPMFMEQAIASYETEAETYMGSMNRAQQAYYLEYEKFSPTVEDLGIGLNVATENFQYAIAHTSADMAIQTAVPNREELSSYVGIVYRQSTEELENADTFSLLCVSNLPATPIPAIADLSPLISGASASAQADCPEGFWAYHKSAGGSAW